MEWITCTAVICSIAIQGAQLELGDGLQFRKGAVTIHFDGSVVFDPENFRCKEGTKRIKIIRIGEMTRIECVLPGPPDAG